MKKIIDRYQYYYIGLCLFVYLLSWFISWDARFNNLILYPFVTQICLPVIGAITLVLALVVKKVTFFLIGILLCFAFWINMIILFGVLPIFGN